MICEQLAQCVDKLHKKQISIPPQKGKKNSNKKRIRKTVYNSPCQNEQRIEKCVVFADKREQPTCSENGKSYSLKIGAHDFDCVCVHIDSGVVDTVDCCKCDYSFFLKDPEKHVILIELKGTSVGHAIEQIDATLQLEALNSSFSGRKVCARISCLSSVPRIYTRAQMELERKLLRFGGNLKIERTPFVEDYSRLDS